MKLEKNVFVEFELPGVNLYDISLTATGSSITLSSVKTMTPKEQRGVYYLKERHFGQFYRRVTLPDHVDLR
jgi:HSP20 family molecular chaperone IbpA